MQIDPALVFRRHFTCRPRGVGAAAAIGRPGKIRFIVRRQRPCDDGRREREIARDLSRSPVRRRSLQLQDSTDEHENYFPATTTTTTTRVVLLRLATVQTMSLSRSRAQSRCKRPAAVAHRFSASSPRPPHALWSRQRKTTFDRNVVDLPRLRLLRAVPLAPP